MRYTIVKSATAEGLTKDVNLMLASGWRLQGGVSTSVGFDFQDDDHLFYFVQAMVK